MRKGRAILALSLFASLLAHVGLLALASRLPRPARAPAPPIELEIVERIPPIPDGPVPSPEVAQRPSPPAPPRSRPPPRAARETEPVAASSAAGPAEGRATVLPERARAPDLAPRWPELAGEGEEAGEGGAAAPPVPPTPDGLDRRVRDMLLEEVPFRRARERADPYWSVVRERLAGAFMVPAEVLEDRAGGGFGPQTREAARAYLAQAKQYGETGNPERPEIYAPHAAAIPHIDEDLIRFQRSEVRRTEPGEDATRIATWVRVDFAVDGAITGIAVERSSGLPAHDRLAVEAVRALPALGPRPADQGASTIWAFETALWIVPPLPVAGCAFDATFVPGPCFYPLKRFVRSTVRLEALP